jgi:hypothetical protein
VNGLSAKDDFTTLHGLCVTLKIRGVDCIALQEPNLDFLQANIREQIQNVCCKHFGSTRFITSTSCIKVPTSWKPGGTMLIILGHWVNAVIRSSTDNLGRWGTATINGQDKRAVTIYSVCNVVKTTIKAAGPSTVFTQQWQLLRLSGVIHPNPHQQTIDDLTADVQRSQNNRETVITVGDFNEKLSDDPNLIASTCTQFNLFEALDYHHGDEAMIPTYIHGTKRLNYEFLQQDLQPFLLVSGFNMFNECVHSDHQDTFLDINLCAFLGDCIPKLAQPNIR